MKLIGDKHVAQSMQQWLGLSPFAKEKSRVAGLIFLLSRLDRGAGRLTTVSTLTKPSFVILFCGHQWLPPSYPVL